MSEYKIDGQDWKSWPKAVMMRREWTTNGHDHRREVRRYVPDDEAIARDRDMLKAENARLLKLLHALAFCADDNADCDKCPMNGSFYAGVSQAFCDQMAEELRKLGMEVEL